MFFHLASAEPARNFSAWLEQPYVKWAVPLPILLALAPIVWLFFRSTWRELDREAFEARRLLHEARKLDYRPLVAFVLAAIVLTLQEYYGGHATFDLFVRKWLEAKQKANPNGWVNLAKYDTLYTLGWWSLARVVGYSCPLIVWRLFFWRDRIRDFGLRTKGFFEHAWIYALCIVILIPLMRFIARQPDFGSYYPFYRLASRSWFDLLLWELLYISQFFFLELFFRGWWVRAMRSLGSAAIFSMAVPYCMIHYGKPYLETCGAIVAGIVLGSLSMKTRSIYAGFLVHITVAVLMDLLALERRNALPQLIHPDGHRVFVFRHLHVVFWAVWALAIALLMYKLIRIYHQRRRMQNNQTPTFDRS